MFGQWFIAIPQHFAGFDVHYVLAVSASDVIHLSIAIDEFSAVSPPIVSLFNIYSSSLRLRF